MINIERMSDEMKNRPMLTCQQVARILGIDDSTVRLQIKQKKIKATKIGPVWAVSPAEVQRYGRQYLGKPGRKKKCSH